MDNGGDFCIQQYVEPIGGVRYEVTCARLPPEGTHVKGMKVVMVMSYLTVRPRTTSASPSMLCQVATLMYMIIPRTTHHRQGTSSVR